MKEAAGLLFQRHFLSVLGWFANVNQAALTNADSGSSAAEERCQVTSVKEIRQKRDMENKSVKNTTETQTWTGAHGLKPLLLLCSSVLTPSFSLPFPPPCWFADVHLRGGLSVCVSRTSLEKLCRFKDWSKSRTAEGPDF